MYQPFDTKEELVCKFIKTISGTDNMSFDEIENKIQAIIYKTRGLMYESIYTSKRHT